MRKKKKDPVSVSKQAQGPQPPKARTVEEQEEPEAGRMFSTEWYARLRAVHPGPLPPDDPTLHKAALEDLFAVNVNPSVYPSWAEQKDLFAKQDAQVQANKSLEEGDYGAVLYDPSYPVEYKKQQAFLAQKAARLPTDSAERKNIPLASGVLDYFPDALAAVAAVSKAGNDQHNPGEPLHWARGKSMDHGDTLIRHFIERGSVDVDGLRHSAKMAWRALALLQLEIEQEKGLPPSRGSR